jgi:hypothetical protein
MACQSSEKQTEADATAPGSDGPASAHEVAPASDTPAANRDAFMANDVLTANRDTFMVKDVFSPSPDQVATGRDGIGSTIDAPIVGVDADKADALAIGPDTALDAPAAADARADALTAPADAAADGALFCTVNGRQVPNGARAYYLNCNACYCNAQVSRGGIWCNSSGCPAPDAGLYACPTGLLSLTYGPTGGFVAYQESSTMNPATWSYTHSRTTMDASTPTLTCTMSLPPCYSSSGEVFGRLNTDLAAPEVADAFARSATPLFGQDLREVDGSVFSVVRSDGHEILVGSPCPSGSTSTCTPIPAGIQQLVDDLKYLDQQILEMQPPGSATACAVFQ